MSRGGKPYSQEVNIVLSFFFPEPKEVYNNVFYSQKLIKINHTISKKYSLKVVYTERTYSVSNYYQNKNLLP